ncbi:MAG: DNA polymerase III subunit delta' [Firmicutes bacterium]|nr:DNA polymerase III subunit delta' [Bacillota bacterium]
MYSLRDLEGHAKIRTNLVNAVRHNRVSHAYLFFGPPGVGKKTAGLAFARALLCPSGDGDACGDCDDCVRSGRGAHPDLHVVRPDGASIKIKQLRGVRDGTTLTSFGEGRQVFLVEQAEKMTVEAANCILKTLEEPPGGVVFILVTDDPAGMPPTVLSRCQCLRFNVLTMDEVLRIITRTSGAGDRAGLAAALAGGSPGRALALLEGTGDRDRVVELALGLTGQRRPGVPAPPEEPANREEAQVFVRHITVLFRDVMVRQQTGAEDLLINIDRREDITALAGAYDRREVLDILITAEETDRRLAGNVNQRLALDSLLLKIAGKSSMKGGMADVLPGSGSTV